MSDDGYTKLTLASEPINPADVVGFAEGVALAGQRLKNRPCQTGDDVRCASPRHVTDEMIAAAMAFVDPLPVNADGSVRMEDGEFYTAIYHIMGALDPLRRTSFILAPDGRLVEERDAAVARCGELEDQLSTWQHAYRLVFRDRDAADAQIAALRTDIVSWSDECARVTRDRNNALTTVIERNRKIAELEDTLAARDARVAELKSRLVCEGQPAQTGIPGDPNALGDPNVYQPGRTSLPQTYSPGTPSAKEHVSAPPGHNPFALPSKDRRLMGA